MSLCSGLHKSLSFCSLSSPQGSCTIPRGLGSDTRAGGQWGVLAAITVPEKTNPDSAWILSKKWLFSPQGGYNVHLVIDDMATGSPKQRTMLLQKAYDHLRDLKLWDMHCRRRELEITQLFPPTSHTTAGSLHCTFCVYTCVCVCVSSVVSNSLWSYRL